MMRRVMTLLLVLMMILGLACSTASAWTITKADWDKVEVDYGASNWAKSTMELAAEAGLIPQLTGNPGFKDTITREQFAELAVNMVTVALGEAPNAEGAPEFTDCDNTQVKLAAAAHIVSGVGNNKFNPKAETNREQIATMVKNSMNYILSETGVDLAPNQGSLDSYNDKAQVSRWAVPGMEALTANGIMSGTGGNNLSPKRSCTVEQSIFMLYQVYANYMEMK